MSTSTPTASPALRAAAARYASEPFIDETVTLLAAVRDRDLDALIGMGDEDFSVIDVDPTGETSLVRTQADWEPWFRRLFLMLDTLDATTDSEITAYRALATSELGYSVVEFRQTITGRSLSAVFDCIATIVWKSTEDGWKEARWHCSVLDREITINDPADLAGIDTEMAAMAGG